MRDSCFVCGDPVNLPDDFEGPVFCAEHAEDGHYEVTLYPCACAACSCRGTVDYEGDKCGMCREACFGGTVDF